MTQIRARNRSKPRFSHQMCEGRHDQRRSEVFPYPALCLPPCRGNDSSPYFSISDACQPSVRWDDTIKSLIRAHIACKHPQWGPSETAALLPSLHPNLKFPSAWFSFTAVSTRSFSSPIQSPQPHLTPPTTTTTSTQKGGRHRSEICVLQ